MRRPVFPSDVLSRITLPYIHLYSSRILSVIRRKENVENWLFPEKSVTEYHRRNTKNIFAGNRHPYPWIFRPAPRAPPLHHLFPLTRVYIGLILVWNRLFIIAVRCSEKVLPMNLNAAYKHAGHSCWHSKYIGDGSCVECYGWGLKMEEKWDFESRFSITEMLKYR